MEAGAVGHNFEMELLQDYPSQIWFDLVQQFQRRFKCDLFIGKNRLKEKFHKKTQENVKLLFAMQLQLKFELIWTCTKAAMDN